MDNALSLAIGTLTLAPSNPEILFVGTGEQTFSASSFFGVGIYRIENASSASPTIVGPINKENITNADIFSGRAIGEILVHPTDPNIIFASSTSGIGGIGPAQPGSVPNRGLFRSTNAMSASPTFTRLAVTSLGLGENRNVVDMVMEPGNPNRIVVSVTGTAAIATTTPPTPADNGGLFLCTNALDATPIFTKTLDIAGNTTTATRTELAINKIASVVTIYAASALNTGTVFRSTDGGADLDAGSEQQLLQSAVLLRHRDRHRSDECRSSVSRRLAGFAVWHLDQQWSFIRDQRDRSAR